ncbi:facilitated trehalose transporter Tret1 [Manduca sexta]|uniref:facilitated trehalose transporter Tret1 n=1 Tax=Manduca sexta TaxID=7130 RepID=UPI001183A66C|nr:facilitated trehalose transporter Tret1 [Manduca sexta]XP_030025813.1 facilitated trehalose transporter Tret1 [Manduca sexta]XP_037295995.1 facilitated trehalose transporter Tret1 [Manduca sexta]
MKLYLRRQLLISSCIYLGQSLCGYIGGWTAPIIPKYQDPNQTPLSDVITDEQASLVGSFVYLGVLLSSLLSGYLANKKGRKLCLMLGGFIGFLGQLLILLSVNLPMLVAARTIAGFGVGLIFNLNLVYLAEIASTNIRGSLLTGTGFFMSFGTLLVYSVGPFVSIAATCYIGLGIALVFTVGTYFIPESPVFKVLKGRNDEAIEILVQLDRSNDIKDIMASEDVNKTINYWDIIKVKTNRKSLLILIALFIFLSMSGSVTMLFYATSIFEMANMDLDSNISTIIIGVTLLASSCLSPLLVERVGRRFLLTASSALSSVFLALLGLYFFLENGNYPVVENIKWLPLLSMMGFFIVFNSGFAIIPSALTSELFASDMRSLGSAITLSFNWFFGFLTSMTFGFMVSALGGHAIFWMYSGICAAAFVFSLIFVPETKGKSFVEIQNMLSK